MSCLFLSVDRIENGFAVCEKEDLSTVLVELSKLPNGTKEGSVLRFEKGEYSIDLKEEERRKAHILKLQNSLFDE